MSATADIKRLPPHQIVNMFTANHILPMTNHYRFERPDLAEEHRDDYVCAACVLGMLDWLHVHNTPDNVGQRYETFSGEYLSGLETGWEGWDYAAYSPWVHAEKHLAYMSKRWWVWEDAKNDPELTLAEAHYSAGFVDGQAARKMLKPVDGDTIHD